MHSFLNTRHFSEKKYVLSLLWKLPICLIKYQQNLTAQEQNQLSERTILIWQIQAEAQSTLEQFWPLETDGGIKQPSQEQPQGTPAAWALAARADAHCPAREGRRRFPGGRGNWGRRQTVLSLWKFPWMPVSDGEAAFKPPVVLEWPVCFYSTKKINCSGRIL